MRLKVKSERVLDNIKKEDDKADLNIGEAPPAIIDDALTSSINIKQEETKEQQTSLQQKGEFGEDGYYYRCDICRTRMANLKSVLEHRYAAHNFKRLGIKKIKYLDTEPDIHDPNFCCKSCESVYTNAHAYRRHLQHVHYMALKPIPKRKTSKNDHVPDPDNPSLYCRACNHTYKHERTYRAHCQYAHGIKSVESENGKPSSSGIMDTYCQTCDKRLASIKSYRYHLISIHKVDWRSIQQKPKDVIPDVNDPNFYCRSCKKTLASKFTFRCHLKLVHCIYLRPSKKIRIEPDINDPNNYCRGCQKTYPSKIKYRHHLRITHQMPLPPLKHGIIPKELPDPYNPQHFCDVCKKSYKSLGIYRMHCKYAHLMVLGKSSIVNPDAIINVKDPKFHCAQCQHTFANRETFRVHLIKIHHLK